MPTLTSDNDDIERELYSLGLSDNLLHHHHPNPQQEGLPLAPPIFPLSPALSVVPSLPPGLPPQAPRSHSAPAPLYPIQTSQGGLHNVFPIHDPSAVHYPGHVQPQDFLTLPRDPTPSTASLYFGQSLTQNFEIPHYAQRSSRFSYQPSYPRPCPYPPQDFPSDYPGPLPNKPPPLYHQQLVVARIEAALRRLQRGLRDSYILSGSHASPPPPQPSSPHLRDPPPSPVPPYDHQSPPGPSNRPGQGYYPPDTSDPDHHPYTFPDYSQSGTDFSSKASGGNRQSLQHPPLRKHKSHPEQFQTQHQFFLPHQHSLDQVRPSTESKQKDLSQGLSSVGNERQHPTRIVCPSNASHLSERLGFKPIQDPTFQQQVQEPNGHVQKETESSGPISVQSSETQQTVTLQLEGKPLQQSTYEAEIHTSNPPTSVSSGLKTFQVEVEVQPLKPDQITTEPFQMISEQYHQDPLLRQTGPQLSTNQHTALPYPEQYRIDEGSKDPLTEKLEYLLEKDPEFYEEYQAYQRTRHHSFHHPHRHKSSHHHHHHHRHHGVSQGPDSRTGSGLRRSKSARKKEDTDKVKVSHIGSQNNYGTEVAFIAKRHSSVFCTIIVENLIGNENIKYELLSPVFYE